MRSKQGPWSEKYSSMSVPCRKHIGIKSWTRLFQSKYAREVVCYPLILMALMIVLVTPMASLKLRQQKRFVHPVPNVLRKLWSCNLCFWSSWGSHRMKSPSGPEPNWSKFIQMECDFSALQHQWFTCIVAVPVLLVASIWFSWRNCTGRKDCGSARVTCVLNVSRHIGIHHINTAYVAGAWLSKHHVFHFPFGRSTFSPSVPTTPRGYRSGLVDRVDSPRISGPRKNPSNWFRLDSYAHRIYWIAGSWSSDSSPDSIGENNKISFHLLNFKLHQVC